MMIFYNYYFCGQGKWKQVFLAKLSQKGPSKKQNLWKSPIFRILSPKTYADGLQNFALRINHVQYRTVLL